MGTFLIVLFTALLLLVSVFLVFVVLLQPSGSNAGLGTAFGGGMAETAFGADTGTVLTRSTIYAIVAFFIISLGLYLGYMGRHSGGSEGGALPDMPDVPVEGVAPEEGAGAVPGPDAEIVPAPADGEDALTPAPDAGVQPPANPEPNSGS